MNGIFCGALDFRQQHTHMAISDSRYFFLLAWSDYLCQSRSSDYSYQKVITRGAFFLVRCFGMHSRN